MSAPRVRPDGRRRQFLRQAVAEQRAIRQLRERVVVRLAIQAFVARAVRQRRAQPLGEGRAVVGHGRIARRLAVVSHDQHRGAAGRRRAPARSRRTPRPQSRIEHQERMAGLFDARDGEARRAPRARWRSSRGRRSRAAPAAPSAPSAAMNRRPCACAVGSSSITPTQWLRVSSRNLGSTMSSARSISLAASKRAIHFAEHFEGAPVALQGQRRDD